MTAPFNWGRLWGDVYDSWRLYGRPTAVDYLRTRIEAAFVPRAAYDKLGMGTLAHISDMGTQLVQAIARAEAAEAENARLTAQLTEARESERAAQRGEFICTKCGRRQDGPTDNEARF